MVRVTILVSGVLLSYELKLRQGYSNPFDCLVVNELAQKIWDIWDLT